MVSMPGVAATCPPITMVAFGARRRMVWHISRTLPTLTMIEEMPTISYSLARSSAAKAACVGKSSTVVGAEMFFWIIRMPHDRWNMRSENGPCSRVTWLWYNSIGLILRLPNASSWAYGPKTELNSTRARVPLGWVIIVENPYLNPEYSIGYWRFPLTDKRITRGDKRITMCGTDDRLLSSVIWRARQTTKGDGLSHYPATI